MRYPCNIIRDIMPLYHDGVASKTSGEAVEEHLAECEICKAYYAQYGSSLCEPDKIMREAKLQEMSARSYKKMFKKLCKKICRWVIGVVVATILLILFFCAVILILYLSWK